MNKLIKLFIKGAAVMIPMWLVILYAVINPLAYLSSDSLTAYWNAQFTNEKQDKYYDVVILGDSMGATSFMPELLSDSTLNLSLSGSGVIEGYYTLEDYLNNNQAPTDVFACYMDYHLAQDDFTWDVCNQVHKFSLKQNKEIQDAIKLTSATDLERVPTDDYWQEVIEYTLYLPSKYITSISNSILESRLATNTESYNNITMRNGRSCLMINDISQKAGLSYNEFSVAPLQSYYYSKLIALCESNNINLHIIKVPLASNTIFTDKYIAEVNGYYMTIMDGHDNVDFVWYPNDFPIECFWDDYHMNQHGAFRFGLQLQADYPELFTSDASPAQMLMLDDDIDIENEASVLFKWIDGHDYTVLILDQLKSDETIDGIYNACLKNNEQYLQNTDMDGMYFVTGNGDNLGNISVAENPKGGYFVTLESGDRYEWNSSEVDGVSLLVIDNANSVVATDKSASFNYESFKFNYME